MMSKIVSRNGLLWRAICIAIAFCFVGTIGCAEGCDHSNTDRSTIETYESIAGNNSVHELVCWMQTICLDCLDISEERLFSQEEPHQFEEDGSVLTCKWCEYQTTVEAVQSTHETAVETPDEVTTIPQVCGICGAEEECICADVLATLEEHNAYVNRLLNEGTCTGLCPVHCDNEEFLLAFMLSRMELTGLPEINDSAMTGEWVCRICLMGDGCSCAERYIEAEALFSYVNMHCSRGDCSGLCPVPEHCPAHAAEDSSCGMYVVITNSNANIRSGPDGSAPRIGNAVYGDAFPYLGESGNWYIIDVYGQTGYVVKTLSTLQDHVGIEPTQQTTVAATPKPTATPAAATRPTVTPCSHPGYSKVEGEITDLGNGEWIQECYKVCTACGEIIDVFYRGGMNVDAAIPVD